jgi:phosphoribosylformylglycinamidine cyclo-ligase
VSINYKQAGVDVEAGESLVQWLVKSPHGKKHHQSQIVSGIGGFASLFRVDFSKMKNPCLVTCTDGVGTKVMIGAKYKKTENLGQDLVAMCVNDLICCGGIPLIFLDYYATGHLDLNSAKDFLLGVQKACDNSQCALVGGETAEMPGVYQKNDFDCAGFAVGVVDADEALGPQRVKLGDRVLGVSSNGFHSNGYSLLRKVFAEDLDKWADYLLRPTHLYVEMMQKIKSENISVHAAAHITGGGIDNVPRVIPENLTWAGKHWKWPEAFHEVQRRTKISKAEMLRTLNCGVGFALILEPSQYDKAEVVVKSLGFETFDLGDLVERKKEGEEIINL